MRIARFVPILLVLASLLAPFRADALTPVTLQLKWKHQFQFAGYYAALEQGYYREAGLDVTLVEADGERDPVDAVLQGRAQFGVGTAELALRRAKGDPVVVLGAIFQHSPLVLIALKRTGLTGVADLAGKRIAVEPSAAELLAYLADEGLTPDRFVLEPHGFSPEALLAGQVAAMSGYSSDEPFLLEQAGEPAEIFTPRAAGIDFYGDVLFTTQAEIARDPKLVRAFLDASLRGWEYAFAHVSETIDLILEKYSTRHSREHLKYEAKRMRRLVLPHVVEPGYQTEARWRHIADTYARMGLIPTGASIEGLVYKKEEAEDRLWGRPALLGLGGIVLVLLGLVWALVRRNRLLARRVRELETPGR